MKLAKDVLDFGLYTNAREAMLQFWQRDVGLAFEETLPAGRGVHQHRHGLNGAVLKLNHSRDPLPDAGPSGYRELVIVRPEIEQALRLTDPDGNRIRLVARASQDDLAFTLRIGVRDLGAHHAFYEDALGLPRSGEHGHRCGRTQLELFHDPEVPADAPSERNARMRAPGFRYLTLQVFDVDAAFAETTARGALPGHPPASLGAVARIAFIRDPDGNWIELSQRASLTGPLPGSGAALKG